MTKERTVFSLHVVVPCGGSEDEVLKTVASIHQVAKVLPGIDVTTHLIYNNGLSPISLQGFCGLKVIQHNINPTASRAKARNVALSQIDGGSEPFVVFIDSGDELIQDALLQISNLSENRKLNDLYICESAIRMEVGVCKRRNRGLRWLPLINPLYLGSVIVRASAIPESVRFREGRKEDWKFWYELFQSRETLAVKWIDAINYNYHVQSSTNHALRKSKLIANQFNFFREFLGNSFVVSLIKTVLHYSILSFQWFVLNRIRVHRIDNN